MHEKDQVAFEEVQTIYFERMAKALSYFVLDDEKKRCTKRFTDKAVQKGVPKATPPPNSTCIEK